MAFASLEATHFWYQKYWIDADSRDFTNAINTNCICLLREFGSDAQDIRTTLYKHASMHGFIRANANGHDLTNAIGTNQHIECFSAFRRLEEGPGRHGGGNHLPTLPNIQGLPSLFSRQPGRPKETSEHDYELEWYQGESDSVPKVKGVFLKVDICIFAPREDGAGVTALGDSGFDEGGVISTAMELVLDSETASCAEITGPLEVKPMNVLPGQTQMHPAHRQSPAPTSSLESEPTPRYNLQSIQDLSRRLDLLAVNERVDALEARVGSVEINLLTWLNELEERFNASDAHRQSLASLA
ncbi:hypothetical protein C8R48DRAFT_793667 [Suillus tomentosus]|nr:hypothetical protein C8R48DRAFT_793667 [Suillus tomentosus]